MLSTRFFAAEFQKRGQYFFGPHTESLSLAMRVHNPNSASFEIESRDPAQTPTDVMEIVCDDFPILHPIRQNINAMLSRAAVSHMQNINGQIIGSK